MPGLKIFAAIAPRRTYIKVSGSGSTGKGLLPPSPTRQPQGADAMQVPVKINFHGLDASEAVEQRVRGEAPQRRLHPEVLLEGA